MLYRWPALGGVFGEHALNRRIELGITIRPLLANRRCRLLGMRMHDDERRAAERWAAGEQLEGDESQRVLVRSRRHGSGETLLGAHVGRRADDDAGLRLAAAPGSARH